MIRDERAADVAAIHAVNAAAFETDLEARIVDALRAAGALTLSLVAEIDGTVVGHIAFSPVTLTAADGTVTAGVGLAPMAVQPAHQRGGLGGALIAAGLERLRGQHPFCVVLGHADYYPRFGFARASASGIRWEHDVPDDVFLVQPLTPGGLDNRSGVIRYRPELSIA